MNWTVVAAIAAGGAAGSVARYAITVFFQRMYSTEFPWWTLSINVIGSFVLGVIVTTCALRWPVGHLGQAFLMVGLLGGFTTFSAFSLDVVTLVERNANVAAAGYIIGSLILSIAGLLSGIALTKALLA